MSGVTGAVESERQAWTKACCRLARAGRGEGGREAAERRDDEPNEATDEEVIVDVRMRAASACS